jgi:hypothetical protein
VAALPLTAGRQPRLQQPQATAEEVSSSELSLLRRPVLDGVPKVEAVPWNKQTEARTGIPHLTTLSAIHIWCSQASNMHGAQRIRVCLQRDLFHFWATRDVLLDEVLWETPAQATEQKALRAKLRRWGAACARHRDVAFLER